MNRQIIGLCLFSAALGFLLCLSSYWYWNRPAPLPVAYWDTQSQQWRFAKECPPSDIVVSKPTKALGFADSGDEKHG
jgi:hypothetical protein